MGLHDDSKHYMKKSWSLVYAILVFAILVFAILYRKKYKIKTASNFDLIFIAVIFIFFRPAAVQSSVAYRLTHFVNRITFLGLEKPFYFVFLIRHRPTTFVSFHGPDLIHFLFDVTKNSSSSAPRMEVTQFGLKAPFYAGPQNPQKLSTILH